MNRLVVDKGVYLRVCPRCDSLFRVRARKRPVSKIVCPDCNLSNGYRFEVLES